MLLDVCCVLFVGLVCCVLRLVCLLLLNTFVVCGLLLAVVYWLLVAFSVLSVVVYVVVC